MIMELRHPRRKERPHCNLDKSATKLDAGRRHWCPRLAQSAHSRTGHSCVQRNAPPPSLPALLARARRAGLGFTQHDSSGREASSAARSPPAESFGRAADGRASRSWSWPPVRAPSRGAACVLCALASCGGDARVPEVLRCSCWPLRLSAVPPELRANVGSAAVSATAPLECGRSSRSPGCAAPRRTASCPVTPRHAEGTGGGMLSALRCPRRVRPGAPTRTARVPLALPPQSLPAPPRLMNVGK